MKEKELEEGEARIDNLLQKIIRANERIQVLLTQLRPDVREQGREKVEMIRMLTETIDNLAVLADEIDRHDEELTKELEQDVRGELQEAVKRIARASRLV